MNGRKLKYGGFSLLATVLFLAGIVLLNVLAGMLTDRFYWKADLTVAGLYTLSEEAEGVLKNLDEDIEIVVLANEQVWLSDLRSLIAEALRNYTVVSGGRVKVTYVDPELNPWLTERYPSLPSLKADDIIISSSRRDTSVAVQSLFSQDYNNNTGLRADQELVGAMQYVLNERIARAVFLTGHEEKAPGIFQMLLERFGYICETADLSSGSIPEDTILLVSLSPKRDFGKEELEKLDAYMSAGGNAMICCDYGTPSLPNLDLYLTEWGVAFENRMVFDNLNYYGYMNFIRAGVQGPSGSLPSMEEFEAYGVYVGAYQSRPISQLWAGGEKGSRMLFPLVSSYPGTSYSKDGSQNIETAEKAPGDEDGPFTLAYIVRQYQYDTNNDLNYSYMIIANAGLVEDALLASEQQYYNAYMVAAIADDLNPFGVSVYIPAKSISGAPMDVTPGQARAALVLLVIALPLVIVILGILMWRRRKNL